MRSFCSAVVIGIGALCAAVGTAHAQTPAYPTGTVRFVVPIGPGSSGDTLTRALAERFRALTGQPTIVENRPGGDLVVATQNVLASPPDGHSVLMVTTSVMILNPMYLKDLPYKAQDLRPVMQLTRHMAALVTSADSRYRTLADAVAAARDKPGTLGVATYGNYYRLGAMTLAGRVGATFNHVPYKGASQVVPDVISGTVDAALVDPGAATALIRAGKLRALAVTGTRRYEPLPDVPTVAESGYPGYELHTFLGFAVSSQTPEPVARRLEELLLQAANQPEFRDFVSRQGGAEFVGANGRQFAESIEREANRYRELAKQAGDALQR
jgi:tripartite-type tricarboxylate transporter receptor subunit TctC